jgi:hypothetical protein
MLRDVWQPTNSQWWTLLIVALLIVAAWPPADDRSLAMKFVNWAVDPSNVSPRSRSPFEPGEGDETSRQSMRDLQTRMYDEITIRAGGLACGWN